MAALSTVSCVKENFNEGQEGTTTFYGKAVDVKTLVLDGHTVWSANDNIKVFYNNTNVVAELKTGENTSSATFEAAVGTATDYYAVYPASETASMTDGTMTVTIPATQNGLFGAGHVAVAKAENKTFTFTNVNAFLKMTFTSAQYTRIVVESIAGEALAGDLSITFTGGTPAVAATYANTSSSVEVTSETPFPAGDFYISVLPGVTHTKGLLVTCYNGAEKVGTYFVDKSVVTEASVTLTFDVFEPNGNYYVTAEGAGNNNGLSLANAMPVSRMVSLLQKATADEAARKAIDGAVFNIAAGEYELAQEALALAYDAAEPVNITFKADGEVKFSGNEAHTIMAVSGADVTLNGIILTKSVATESNVGAIKVSGENTTLTLDNCQVYGNTVDGEQISCAGIAVLEGAGLVIKDCVFTENNAYSTAVLYVNGGDVTATGSHFESNWVDASVGVMLLEGAQTASFTNCEFIDNHAYQFGMIQHVSGQTTFTNCNFKDNGVYKTKFPGVFQLDEGGSGKLTIIGGECSGNEAGTAGVLNQEMTGAEFEMTDVLIKNNHGYEQAGAMWVGAKGTLTRCTLSSNTSDSTDKKKGQSMTVKSPDFGMYGCIVENHVGKKSSNAIAVIDDARLTIGSDSQGKRSVIRNNTADWGGACSLTGTSEIIAYDTDIVDNHAKGSGSFRILEDSDLYLTNCVFRGNYTTNGNGGAFAFESAGTLYCNGCHFEDNYAQNEGGAIMVDNGSSDAYLNACTFKGNYSQKQSFGTTVYVHTNNSFAMNNCTIADDTYSETNHASEPRISWLNFNQPLKVWLSNNTFIGVPRHNGTPTYGGLIRIWFDVDTDAYFVNNIVVNDTQENTWSFCQYAMTLSQTNVPSVKLYHTKYSVFEGADDTQERLVFMENPTSSDFTRDYFGGLTWNADKCYWSWNGTMTGGANTNKITKDEFVATMNTAAPEFKTWLESIDALDKDQLGNSRGSGEWWPGSYQKN